MKPTLDPRAAGLVPVQPSLRPPPAVDAQHPDTAPTWSTQLQRALAEAQPASAPPPWLGEPAPARMPLEVSLVDALAESLSDAPRAGHLPAQGSATDLPGGGPRQSTRRVSSSLRLTVRQDEQGVSVWIGAEREALAHIASIARAVHDLLEHRGLRLVSIVCNGRPLALQDFARTHAGPVQSIDTAFPGEHGC
jgi:hypothetical protein